MHHSICMLCNSTLFNQTGLISLQVFLDVGSQILLTTSLVVVVHSSGVVFFVRLALSVKDLHRHGLSFLYVPHLSFLINFLTKKMFSGYRFVVYYLAWVWDLKQLHLLFLPLKTHRLISEEVLSCPGNYG